MKNNITFLFFVSFAAFCLNICFFITSFSKEAKQNKIKYKIVESIDTDDYDYITRLKTIISNNRKTRYFDDIKNDEIFSIPNYKLEIMVKNPRVISMVKNGKYLLLLDIKGNIIFKKRIAEESDILSWMINTVISNNNKKIAVCMGNVKSEGTFCSSLNIYDRSGKLLYSVKDIENDLFILSSAMAFSFDSNVFYFLVYNRDSKKQYLRAIILNDTRKKLEKDLPICLVENISTAKDGTIAVSMRVIQNDIIVKYIIFDKYLSKKNEYTFEGNSARNTDPLKINEEGNLFYFVKDRAIIYDTNGNIKYEVKVTKNNERTEDAILYGDKLFIVLEVSSNNVNTNIIRILDTKNNDIFEYSIGRGNKYGFEIFILKKNKISFQGKKKSTIIEIE